MENSRLAYLFRLQLAGKATVTEREELTALMGHPESVEQVKDLINGAWAAFEPNQSSFTKEESNRLLQQIISIGKNSEAVPLTRARSFYPWMKVAAAVLVLLIGVAVYFNRKIDSQGAARSIAVDRQAEPQLMPGGDKATLTLADGTVIQLDSASGGQLAWQGNTSIVKLSNGEVVYKPQGTATREIVYNSMSTPRGGQYRLRLPDGTEVWLNAASSIRYPNTFYGSERRVEITGEAYFEVTKNAKMPFKVFANGMEIKVLGTHFNVNAYQDELSTQTTLVEGSVQITKGKASTLLTPGQQARVTGQDKITLINDADTEEVLAWKNGLFLFHATNIESIMRQVSRWYNVEILYDVPAADLEFSGAVSRKGHVSEILKIMELTGLVHFKIEGKKITVIR